MDQDIDMDAPEISTLKDEESPPPQPKASGSGRRTKTKAPSAWPRPRRKENLTDDEYDEVEEEEDQLIDDDEDELMKPVPVTALPNPTRSGEVAKKRTSSKRKPRKSEKRIAEDERKAQEKVMTNVSGRIDLAPTMTWFEATPSELLIDVKQSVNVSGQSKVATPKKTPKKLAKTRTKLAPTKLKTAMPLPDDAAGLSEAHTGTAASSPVTAQFDAGSPEPEGAELTGSLVSIPLTEETNLENAPVPHYPLPTKPFPVQPAPKIPTGFAPVLSLDKSKKKVRHWRIARREIRGIAGGRWFTTTWVGEKESEYASSLPKPGEERLPGTAPPRLSAVSMSAPVKGKGKVKAVSSLAASTAPSRSGSSIPDVPTTNVRPQTKMRNIVAAPQSEGDSDLVTPGP
ncbi:hypothetical protein E4T56_gene5005 [Termitomyces sp. T112]|nr:hypothetical protein E4T56_gene5005 [Termitomyces sp. T112]KAH0591273.1 hypothetical protein H2248_001363 [Termitomyces sp. 'cryptogamus']KNZ76349.1 hypothetical protein J132_10628 [Termitomyces sp. J132]